MEFMAFLSDLGAWNIIAMTLRRSRYYCKTAAEVIISPGPGIPGAGMTIELISLCHVAGVPLLGVCLGHQALACAFGGGVKPSTHLSMANYRVLYAPTAMT